VKVLRIWLEHHGFDPAGLRRLCDHDEAAGYALTISANEGRSTWELLREAVSATGYWPVILIDHGEGFPLRSPTANDADPQGQRTFAEILAAASDLNFEDWVHEQHLRRITSLKEDADGGAEEDISWVARELLSQRGELRSLPRTVWPGDAPLSLEEIDYRLTGFAELPSYRLSLALFPVRESWQVPALLRWRAHLWPHDPALHAAALRSWQERYQAELVSLGPQTMHLRVGKPPTTRRAALRLAKEHFHYCEDVISNRFDSVDEMAARLIRGGVWYFVWED
jgi:hypothetical protein